MVLFFFNDTATTEIYTLSLHDALPISRAWPSCRPRSARIRGARSRWAVCGCASNRASWSCAMVLHPRSEEHTSELQSRPHLVCRLLLEKKKILDNITRASAG